MKKIIIFVILLLFVLTGCAEKDLKSSSNEIKKSEDETVKVNAEKKVKEEKEIIYIKQPLEIQKFKNLTIYQSKENKVEVMGYGVNEDGNYILAVEYIGDVRDASENQMSFDVILEDGETQTVNEYNICEVRKTENGRIDLYLVETQAMDREITRIDYTLSDNYDSYTTEGEIEGTLVLEEPVGKETVAGVEMLDNLSYSTLKISKDGTNSTVNIESLDIMQPEMNRILIKGNLVVNQDVYDLSKLYYSYPFIHKTDESKMIFENDSEQLFAGTTVPFQTEIELEQPIGKNEGAIYFSIDNALFGFDLTTGEETSSISLTQFPIDDVNPDIVSPTADGFEDIENNIHYNAVKLVQASSNDGVGTLQHGRFQYSIGGDYKTLTFDMGTGYSDTVNKEGYTVQVYGDDYDYDGNGTPIFEQKINTDSPMEPYTVNVEGIKVLTFHINSHIVTTDFDDDTKKFPIIFSDLILNK